MFAGVERRTVGLALSHAQRFNHYPATPMALISWVFEGDLHMVEQRSREAAPQLGPRLPRLVLSGPQRRPSRSWSPGPVHALSVAFYPEAMARLLGTPIGPWVDKTVPLNAVAPGPLLAACDSLFATPAGVHPFDLLQELLQPLWRGMRAPSPAPLLGDWVRSLAVHAAFTRTGAGIRQLQRRIKNWTGQSRRELQVFERVEDAWLRVAGAGPEIERDLAGLACDAGFADQSHMGRQVRRVTGNSPAKLLQSIRRDEAFWFYRLMEGHVQEARPTGGRADEKSVTR